VPEGRSRHIRRLAQTPQKNVTVTFDRRRTGDTSPRRGGGSIHLHHTPTSAPADVTIEAAERRQDTDTTNGTRNFTVASKVSTSVSCHRDEVDNDKARTPVPVVTPTASQCRGRRLRRYVRGRWRRARPPTSRSVDRGGQRVDTKPITVYAGGRSPSPRQLERDADRTSTRAGLFPRHFFLLLDTTNGTRNINVASRSHVGQLVATERRQRRYDQKHLITEFMTSKTRSRARLRSGYYSPRGAYNGRDVHDRGAGHRKDTRT